MPTWQAILRHVSFSVSSTVGPRGAGQAEGVQVLVHISATNSHYLNHVTPFSELFLFGWRGKCQLYIVQNCLLKNTKQKPWFWGSRISQKTWHMVPVGGNYFSELSLLEKVLVCVYWDEKSKENKKKDATGLLTDLWGKLRYFINEFTNKKRSPRVHGDPSCRCQALTLQM